MRGLKLYQAQYTVIKFVPDLIKNEPINIGLILQSTSENYLRTQFSKKKIERIHKYNEEVDSSIIQLLIADIEGNYNNECWVSRGKPYSDFKDSKLLNKLSASHGNQIQFDNPRGLVTESLDNEFNVLFDELVFKATPNVKSRGIEERTMHKRFRDEFKRRGLIENDLIAEDYKQIGKYGEEIKFDFSYLNGKRNLINNISFNSKLKTPMDLAKIWLSNYNGIKESNKKQNSDVEIKLVYYIPKIKEPGYDQILGCLRESSDELIDYDDTEKVEYFINHIEKTAHK